LKNVPVREFSTDDIIYYKRNPRIWKVYGYSPVEQIVLTVNLALRRQTSVLQHFTEGNVPEGLMFTPRLECDQVREFDSWFNSLLSGNTAEMRRIKFVPGGDGGKFEQIKPVELKSHFDEWLARIVCFAFSVPPTAFVSMMNRATAEQADETGKTEGLLPLITSVENLLNQILSKWGGYDDIEFSFVTERAVDAMKQAEADSMRIKAGVMTIDEIRIRDGLEPFGIGPGILTPTGWVPLPVKGNEHLMNPQPNPGNPNSGKPAETGVPQGGPTNKESETPPAEKVAKGEKKNIHVSNSLEALPQAELAALDEKIKKFFESSKIV
jgi:phage portal protein BeeE